MQPVYTNENPAAGPVPHARSDPLPETELRAGDEVPDIVVRVGPTVARLKGKIMDAATGKWVITDAKDPHYLGPVMVGFYEANGDHVYMDLELGCKAEFSVLVPTKPFRISVSAPGYKTWYYGSDGTKEHAMPMLLPSATTDELTITLKPACNEPACRTLWSPSTERKKYPYGAGGARQGGS